MYQRRLAAALPGVRERIERAAHRVGRDPSEVTLVIVTKGHGIEAAQAAVELGLRDLGENRIERIESLAEHFAPGVVRWHMIGRLQRRKASQVRPHVTLLHSLDSLRLAERLDLGSEELGARVLSVLLQVNTSGEGSKAGFAPERVVEEAARILAMPSLSVEGLMTMAPFTSDERVLRHAFSRLRQVQEELRAQLPEYRGAQLSMGMSNDFEVAVEEGITIVRLGTVLLGERTE